MLNFVLPGLLACAVLTQAGDRLRIGIRLQTPPSMPTELVNELVRETERHWKFSALELHWHHSGAKCTRHDNRLLIVRFRGACAMHRVPVDGEVKPLGHTHVSDDHVLPFIEVDCDSVSVSLLSRDRSFRHILTKERYARALAVVLTHEMVHALTASREHASSGIMQRMLTPADLDEESISLSSDTIESLAEALNVPLAESRHD